MTGNPSPPRRVIDVACVLVVAATIAMYFIDQQSAADASSTQAILGLALAKCILVGAIFMGLMWKSKGLFAIVAGMFVSLYVTLIAVLTISS